MSEQSDKWDSQWSELLTHCYGDVKADAGFKSRLLSELKMKTAWNHSHESDSDAVDEAKWSRLLTEAYVPCTPNPSFKKALFSQLKASQARLTGAEQREGGEEALQAILSSSYQPVKPRREFQTRLLENLKERQRTNTTIRTKTRRRTIFVSALTSMAAAAMVIFVVWVSPMNSNPVSVPVQGQFTSTSAVIDPQVIAQRPPAVASEEPVAEFERGDIIPASWQPDEPSFNYLVADAFAHAPLPSQAVGLRNMEVDAGDGWQKMDENSLAGIRPGMRFRSSPDAAGHLGFSDQSMISMSPDTMLEATEEGFSFLRGTALVSVPDSTPNRFRLHFPERDIAVEPGTQLALFVEPAENYAEGGAPAPLVMVIEDQDTEGGFALARGRNGIGPLFARYIYTLDKYVTPDLPGRVLCDVECEDLEKMFKTQTLNQPALPMASFAGGFGTERYRTQSTTKYTPAGFSKNGARWQADSYREDMPTTKIRYLSDDYFGLANQRRDLARGLALGSEVIIDAGDGTFYEIYK